MADKFVKENFIKLTSKTYPHGYEDELVRLLPNPSKDKNGNYYINIGNTKTIFASHLDTASKDQVNVKHIFDYPYIKTDGKSILGADDKAGVVIMLWMIKNKIPGLYYFFIGEEVGCIGSKAASLDYTFSKYDRIISFDRKGTESIITHQSWERTCSDEFAISLANELNKQGLKYKIDDTGIYTDSAEFTKLIPECTNISVGYYKEHTFNEHQDIQHLINLCKSVLKVNWESLPTKRDKTKTEYKDYYGRSNTWNHSEYDNWSYRELKTKNNKKTRRSNDKKKGLYAGRFDDGDNFENRTFFDDKELVKTGHKSYKYNEYTTHTGMYDILKEKFLTTKISKKEINIIKEQYINLDDMTIEMILSNSENDR